MEQDEQREAKRLLNIEDVSNRAVSRRSGICRNNVSDYRYGRKPISLRAARKVIATFWELSDELKPKGKRPKVKRNETDQEP